jgi:hypothetical protein
MEKSHNPVNFDLLLKAIHLDNPDKALQEAKFMIENNRIDCDDLYNQADFHDIKSQLRIMLNKMPANLTPVSLNEKLKEDGLDNLHRQLRNVSEFFEIKNLLDEAHIPAIPFKGFWLAHSLYGNLGARESVDIDLMIDAADLPRIQNLMWEKGYITEEFFAKYDNAHLLRNYCEYNFDFHENGFRKFHFEFHWRIHNAVYGMNITLGQLRDQIMKESIQNRELSAFTPSANLLLMIMHHGGKDQFSHLKQILDIALALKQGENLDWKWLLNIAKQYHIEKLLYIGIGLAARLTGIAIPDLLKDNIQSRQIRIFIDDRIYRLANPDRNMRNLKHYLHVWPFIVRSRSGIKLKWRIFLHGIKSNLSPQLVPE